MNGPATILLAVATLALAGAQSLDGEMGHQIIKKYAMMKIFEDCYGKETVRDMMKAMSAACDRCHAMDGPSVMAMTPSLPFRRPAAAAAAPAASVAPPLRKKPYARPTFSNFHRSDLEWMANPMVESRSPFLLYPIAPPPAFYEPYPPVAPNFMMVKREASSTGHLSNVSPLVGKMHKMMLKMQYKMSNMTCVLKDLGMLDQDHRPNYEAIEQMITTMAVDEDMKADLKDGVEICRQFSMCMPPEKTHSPLMQRLAQPMAFFKCLKGKKLHACIRKDLRSELGPETDEKLNVARRFAEDGDDDDQVIDATAMFDNVFGFDADESQF